ncbi:MAG: ATP-binding cassette domain-containing protein, partial [Elusimicrobiaceae bacterium]
MITINNVSKSFGQQLLFENAFLQINEGDKFALVGPNGAGKSTLLKMILGWEKPDDGAIAFR